MASPQNFWTYATSAVTPSGDPLLDSLLGDFKYGSAMGTGTTLSYSFPWANSGTPTWATPTYSPNNEPLQGSGLSLVQQAAFRSALATWSAVANVQFNEVADTSGSVGEIRVAWTQIANPPGAAWTWQTPDYWASASDIWLSSLPGNLLKNDPASNWQPGSFSFMALVHELGHALWLDHPFEATPPLSAQYDTQQYTVMSYTDHPHSDFVRYAPAVTHADGSVSISWETETVYPSTPMLLDIAALQYLYGANTNWHTGGDVYTFDPATPFFMTLWDAGGNDTLSISNFQTDSLIDLRAGHFSSLTILPDTSVIGLADLSGFDLAPATPYDYNGTDNLAIAWGAVIENATGGNGDDVLMGNEVANELTGNAGDDTLHGGQGADTLQGGQGLDTAWYDGTLASYSRTRTAPETWSLNDLSGNEGADQLGGVERLLFSDARVALDLSPDDPAGQALAFMGVLTPAAISNPASVGQTLGLFDQGASLRDAFELACDTNQVGLLALGASNADVAALAYRNVFGAEADAATVDLLSGYMDGRSARYSQADFLTVFSLLDANQAHIDLVGLQQTGIAYL